MIFQCITLEFDKYFIVTGSKNFIMCLAFIATSLGVSLCIFMYTYVDRMRVNVFIDRIHTIFRVIYIFFFLHSEFHWVSSWEGTRETTSRTRLCWILSRHTGRAAP